MQEQKLIEQIKQGDQSAFELLIAPHREKIFSHLHQMVKDEQIAEDLAQEAYIHAFQKLSSFHQHSSFYTWVWRIAHNLALNWIKKEKRTKMIELHEEKLAISNPAEFKVSQDELSVLSSKQKEVLMLYLFEGLKQREIAERLKVPFGTVRSRLYYARKKLSKLK